MQAPRPTRLFHITAIANLPAIFSASTLVSKNIGALVGIDYQNIAHGGAQGKRALRPVPNPPGGVVHDFVPFYFAPRSPMLFAIHRGAVQNCHWGQDDIVYFETTIEAVTVQGKDFVFYDRNATLAFSEAYTDLSALNEVVAWDILTEHPQMDGYCQYWNNKPDHPRYADRMERRQAEFLVKDHVHLSQITRLGVINADKQVEVQALAARFGVYLPVDVMPDWYF